MTRRQALDGRPRLGHDYLAVGRCLRQHGDGRRPVGRRWVSPPLPPPARLERRDPGRQRSPSRPAAAGRASPTWTLRSACRPLRPRPPASTRPPSRKRSSPLLRASWCSPRCHRRSASVRPPARSPCSWMTPTGTRSCRHGRAVGHLTFHFHRRLVLQRHDPGHERDDSRRRQHGEFHLRRHHGRHPHHHCRGRRPRPGHPAGNGGRGRSEQTGDHYGGADAQSRRTLRRITVQLDDAYGNIATAGTAGRRSLSRPIPAPACS